MASNKGRTTLLFRSKVATIATSIVAIFLVFSLLSTFRHVGAQPEVVEDKREKFGHELELPEGVDEEVKFYLRCLNRHEAPPAYYDLLEDILCRDTGRALTFSYRAHGRLPPKYVEALQIKYKGNQTLIDIMLCDVDFRRCSEETRELRMRYFDELHP